MYAISDRWWTDIAVMPGDSLLLMFIRKTHICIGQNNNHYTLRLPKFKEHLVFKQNSTLSRKIMLFKMLWLSKIFYNENHNGIDETAIHTFKILSNVWTRLDNLDGQAEHLISFKRDQHNYIVQTNRSLWLTVISTWGGLVTF